MSYLSIVLASASAIMASPTAVQSALAEPPTMAATRVQGSSPSPVDRAAQPPIVFAERPVVRTAVGHDDPFVEGSVRYSRVGVLKTDAKMGKRIILPAGMRVYGQDMTGSDGSRITVWCGFPEAANHDFVSKCLAGGKLAGSSNDSLVATAFWVNNLMTYTGGDVESAEGDLQLGGKITVRFFVQNLGKIPRIWGNGFVGDQRVNKWGLILGSITDSSAPDELLFAIGGGIVGIRPDPDAKGHYIVRELIPLSAGGSVALQRLQTRAR